jgi:DeoR/GlpR family transcriptional regulator of sugar metabolism
MVLELLQSTGEVSVADLSRRAAISEMTVRRDLDALQRDGIITRLHGKAISAVSRSHEPPYALRAQRNVEAKVRIGRLAASLLSSGETVILDVGTTVLEVARALLDGPSLTVLTPSLRIAQVLADEPRIRLMLTGGLLRAGESSLISDLAERAFQEFRFDTFMIGVGGLDVEAGLTEFNLDDARVKRSALTSVRRCIVLADATKLGQIAFAKICPLDRVDVLVTDPRASAEAMDAIRSTGVEVLVAE